MVALPVNCGIESRKFTNVLCVNLLVQSGAMIIFSVVNALQDGIKMMYLAIIFEK